MAKTEERTKGYKEIESWRRWFLKQKLVDGAFKHIAEHQKSSLEAYFLSIPSLDFENPERAWEDCLSALLQSSKGN